MLSRNLKRLVTWLAFLAALIVPALFPRIARAAIVPACEVHELSRMPVEWLSPPPASPAPATDSCSVGEVARHNGEDELGDLRVAAMCDESGASVVAPPRVLPVADARIDAAPGCVAEVSAPVIGPGPKDAPIGPPAFALAEHALPGGALLVPPVSSELAPPYPACAGAPRAGVKHAIEHPPR